MNKSHQFSRVVAVEEFNDLGLTQEMAAGVPILYNVMHVVLQCCQMIERPPLQISPVLKTLDAHKVSVKSLFIFEIFEETLRSIVRSPISTTKPPLISEFTLQSVSLCEGLGHHCALPWV